MDGSSPFSKIIPVDDPQPIGLICELLDIFGLGSTVTVVFANGDWQLPSTDVMFTEYTPLLMGVILGMTGFCNGLAKPFGPVQEYVTTPAKFVDAVKYKVSALQTLMLLVTVGAEGLG